MITVRKLEPEEYTLVDYGKHLDPDESIILGAFVDGKLIGSVAAVCPVHVEGYRVDEEHRGSLAAWLLHKKLVAEMKERGITKLFAYVTCDEHKQYMRRLGYTELPWAVMEKEI